MWRARRHETSQSCRLAAVQRADGVVPDITILRKSFAAYSWMQSGPRALGQELLHAAVAVARISPATPDHGVPRDGSRSLRPLGLLRGGPATGTRALRLPPSDAAAQRTRLRRRLRACEPSRIELCAELQNPLPLRASCAKHHVYSRLSQLSVSIAASGLARLYFAPLLQARAAHLRLLRSNQ